MSDWIGLDWIGFFLSDWIGLDWIGLCLSGLDWIGLDWIGDSIHAAFVVCVFLVLLIDSPNSVCVIGDESTPGQILLWLIEFYVLPSVLISLSGWCI